MRQQAPWWSWAVMIVGMAFLLQSPLGVRAQDAPVVPDSQNPEAALAADEQDPPGPVARLSYIEGSVSLQPGGENEWVAAGINRPLVTGDNLWTDEGSRAEVQVGSTALRLSSRTGITLLEVSDRATQIRLAEGSLIVKVRHVDEEDSYEVDTANAAFTILQPGEYRIEADADGNRTDVTVWRGRGEVTGGGSAYTIVANQHATFSGTEQLNYDIGQIPDRDDFDAWAFGRDQNEERSDSANYVSRETTGYDDLDANGDWIYVAGYGMCWQPRALAAGWAPYRFGRWIWVGPWGWTWVADEPWGFAPFHYGRWAYGSNGWLWVPGPLAARPIYAPALVAWVGGRPGFNFGFGAGVGWLPLAPGEVFIPGYRVSRTYVNRVNTTNTSVNIAKVSSVYTNRNSTSDNVTYANRSVNGGVTVVSRDTFVNARPVSPNVKSVPAHELAAAPATHLVGVEPGRSSVLGAGPAAIKPPAAVTSRPVVALRTPATMPRSFDPRQAAAGGQLHQPSIGQPSIGQPLVRQQPPGQPVPMTSAKPPRSDEGFRAFSPDAESTSAKPRPRVWEEQGTPEPERNTPAQPENRNVQSAQTRSHPAAKPLAPAQPKSAQPEPEEKFSGWHQQKTASPTAQKPQPQNSHPAHAPSAPKK
jgi:hypothetical protein